MGASRVATTASHANRLEGIPERARPLIRRGFAVATTVAPEARMQVLDHIFQQFAEHRPNGDAERVATDTNLPVQDAANLLSAFSVILAYYTVSSASVDEFIDEGRDIIFDEESESVVREIVDVVASRRDSLNKSFERTAVARAVLPSLEVFEIVVDARLVLKDEEIQDIIAVAVARIDTDYENSQIVVQLTRSDIEDIMKKLNNALVEINIAENLNARL
jgi:hypothetical protein